MWIDRPFTAMFEHRDPDTVAIVTDDERISFGELRERCVAFSTALSDRGIAVGDPVLILGRREPNTVVALIGSAMAGATFALVDEHLAPRALESVVATFAPRLTIYPGSRPPRGMPNVVSVGARSSSPVHMPSNPDGRYVAFTSGTTGQPKGVVARQAPVGHFLTWAIDHFSLSQEDRFALLGGIGHDPAVREILLPLWVGGSLAIPSTRQWCSPSELDAFLARSACTTSFMTPTMARRIVAVGSGSPLMRRVVLGGEQALGADVTGLRSLYRHAQVFNAYGATETPQIVSCIDVTEYEGDDVLPVGDGVPGTLLDLVDDEVVVSGNQVAEGYLGSTDQRAFDRGDESIPRYRTGDIGSRSEDGDIVLVGRRDQQVKIAGARVEPTAVAAVLRRMPGVADAAVGAEPTGQSTRPWALRAMVAVTEPDGLVTRRAVQAWLLDHVELTAIPDYVHLMKELPMTDNGKVAFPDAIRTVVLEEMRVVLGAPELTFESEFFDAGGDSLSAMELAIRLSDALGIDVTARDIFAAGSVDELAKSLAPTG